MKFDSNFILANYNIKYPQPIMTIDLKKGNKLCVAYDSGLKCLWDSVFYNGMVKENS